MTSATATAPAFSFAGLSIKDADVPKVAREKAVRDNPFTGVMRESYEKGTGKSITIPAAAVPQAVYLLRSAAAEQGLGSRIVLQDSKGARLELGSEGGTVNDKGRTVGGHAIVVRVDGGTKYNGQVNVLFLGKTPKQTKRNATAAAPTA